MSAFCLHTCNRAFMGAFVCVLSVRTFACVCACVILCEPLCVRFYTSCMRAYCCWYVRLSLGLCVHAYLSVYVCTCISCTCVCVGTFV